MTMKRRDTLALGAAALLPAVADQRIERLPA